MIPILFEHNATQFTINGAPLHGLGDLINAYDTSVEQTDEGEYEFSFSYPVNSELFSELKPDRIILVKPNPYDPLQAFRIYGYTKELNGVIGVNCQHLSYDLAGIPVKPFKDLTRASDALNKLRQNAMVTNPFTFSTDITKVPETDDSKFTIDEPLSARALLLDGDESIKGAWGGDLIFDNYSVRLAKQGGEDRGALIEYGVNITELSMEENISELVTGVIGYWKGKAANAQDDDDDIFVYGTIQRPSGTFDHEKVIAVNLSEFFQEQPSVSAVNSKTQEYIRTEKIGEPEINLTVKYSQLDRDVRMYDAVTVRFLKMGIDVKAKVTGMTYDPRNERIIEITVSNAKHTSKWNGFEDASRLKRGTLSSNRIGNGSIGGSKLGSASVSGWHLVDGAVGGSKIAPKAVTEEKVADEAVSTEKIQKKAVTVYQIGDNAVTSSKIEDGAVVTNKILNKAVELAKLSNTLQVFYTDTLAANSIVADYANVMTVESGYISTQVISLGTGIYAGTTRTLYKPMMATAAKYVLGSSYL